MRGGASMNTQDDLRSILFLVRKLETQGGMNESQDFTNIKTNDIESHYHSSFSPFSFTRTILAA